MNDERAVVVSSVLEKSRVRRQSVDGRRRLRISAIEAAEAAALADVAAAICVLSRVLPIAGAAILVSSIPFAVLGIRRRLSVCILAGVTGWIVALLFGGYGTANMVAGAAVSGCFAGIAIRRRWSPPTVLAGAILGLGVPSAALTTAGLAVFSSYREFIFDNIRNGVGGAARLIGNAGATQVEEIDRAVVSALRVWPITIPVATLLGVVFTALFTYLFVKRPAQSLARRLGPPSTDVLVEETGRIAPVPMELRDVSVTHPGATSPTVWGMNADITPGRLTAVAGRNGAGKSTLARVISGRAPTTGVVIRAGNPGLGAPGGTAVIGQRPETGVLGLQVGDDLAWGDPTMTPERARALLARVGLDVALDAETSRLSGGQLQRLAIAGALARDPQLLVSDESTAMIDGPGREALMTTYRRLADGGTAVVHVTHDPREIAAADATIVVPGGDTEPATPPAGNRRNWIRGGRLDVRGLRFAHDSGTPWHREVLADIDMTIAPGQTVLVSGANGAGKSTLARLLAGIEKPDAGEVHLDGEPVLNNRDGALFGHQYARLSLVRSRVRDDICDAAGVDRSNGRLVWESLRELGLDPSVVAEMRVDHLSVGQQRRVALAGLLAARPRVLVLDEPLAGLDDASRIAMVAALQRVRASGTTLVIVTHDLNELRAIADRAIDVAVLPPRPPTVEKRPSRASMAGVVGRVLPRSSPAHRLWVGSKVFAIVATALMFAIDPGWITVGASVLIAAAWTLAGRIPVAALPRLPWWIFALMGLGGFVTAMGGGRPFVTVFDVRLGLGGASTWAVLISITIVSFYLSLVFCWTTPMAEVPAFGQRVVGWARRVGIPLQPVVVAVTVALRLLPFMISDFRVLLQTVGQRRTPGKRSAQQRVEQWSACMPIACSLAVQNAREVATAMDNRGGIGSVARADRRPGIGDVIAIVFVAAVVVAAIAVG